MFVLRDDIDHIDLDGGQILNFMTSINQPLVAAADRPPELTQSYVCSRQNDQGLINVFIMLHLVKSNLKVIYSLDQELPLEMLREAEDEALTFTENMGFLMDSVALASLSDEDKMAKLSEFPIFQAGRHGVAMIPPERVEDADEVIEEIDIVEGEELEAVDDEGLSIEEPMDLEDEVEEVIDEEEEIILDQLMPEEEGPEVTEFERLESGEDSAQMEAAVVEQIEAVEPEPEIDQALDAVFPGEEQAPRDPLARLLRFLSSF